MDSSSKNNSCGAGYPYTYTNSKYKDDKESYMKLNGNSSFNCTFKEWEVYKVEFQN